MIVVVIDGQTLHRRHVLLGERMLGVEERRLLEAVEVRHQKTLVGAIVRGKRRQRLQQAVVRRVAGRDDEETRVEVARVHVHGAEVTALKQLVDVVKEQVVRVHVNHALVVQHIPHVQLVQRVLEVLLVRPSPLLVRFESTSNLIIEIYGFSIFWISTSLHPISLNCLRVDSLTLSLMRMTTSCSNRESLRKDADTDPMVKQRLCPHSNGQRIFVVPFCSLIVNGYVSISRNHEPRAQFHFAVQHSTSRERTRTRRSGFIFLFLSNEEG